MKDNINSPAHYADRSATLEPIDVLRFAPFDLGNALKYLIRAGYKDDAKQDIEKGMKYLRWASESCELDGAPYYKFFDSYGLLLGKLPRCAHISSSSWELVIRERFIDVYRSYYPEEKSIPGFLRGFE